MSPALTCGTLSALDNLTVNFDTEPVPRSSKIKKAHDRARDERSSESTGMQQYFTIHGRTQRERRDHAAEA
ncbi:MAG: hypothetical protein ACLQO1_17480 [Steroidobacteraceae bacterium]